MHKPFPYLIHAFDVGGYKEKKNEFIKFVSNERRKKVGNIRSNREGWQSDMGYCQSDDIVSTFIREEVVTYIQYCDMLKPGVKGYFKEMWYNINGKGSYNVMHSHPDSHLSGIFWLNVPKDSGETVFFHPQAFNCGGEYQWYKTEYRDMNGLYTHMALQPEEGRMVIFPSYLFHRVERNNNRQDRISCSFNLKFIK